MIAHDELLKLCSGDIDAVRFIDELWGFVQIWDDLIDKDKEHDDAVVNKAMLWALFGLQNNKFYAAHRPVLSTAMLQSISSWMIANKFKKSGNKDLIEQAYFMRCAGCDVIATAVLLSGGFDKQLQAVERLRSLAPHDTLELYLQKYIKE